MKRYIKIKTLFITLLAMASLQTEVSANDITTDSVSVYVREGRLNVHAQLVLDGVKLASDRQLYITPVFKAGEKELMLPSVLVNGRNMHYAYERGILKNTREVKSHNIAKEEMRRNGTSQRIPYSFTYPAEKWMLSDDARLAFLTDSCGCGVKTGVGLEDAIPLCLNPVKQMNTVMVTPAVTELPVEVHEGRARVQFEVDKTVLHDSVYRCKNGQRIDNRAQLRMIDDSVRYALSDPNVEIASIAICGYASPESPYLHNEELATGRSRALAEYLADKYKLPHDRSTYSSVPENWKEFREIVVESKEISEKERVALLELIDRPAYGASDYDAKEKELNTSPVFRNLYRKKILPEWFPKLRATTFAISTRLKPMPDEDLLKIIDTTPSKMSLNQMFRVARLFPEGSDGFNRIIGIALEHYPDDPTANLNAAAAAVASKDYGRAKQLLQKASDSPEADNLRGIIATAEGDFEEAAKWFDKAGALPEGTRNRNLLP